MTRKRTLIAVIAATALFPGGPLSRKEMRGQ